MSEYLTATNLILAGLAYLGLCGVAGLYVSTQLGRPSGEGFLLGAFFGPLGLIVAACLPARDLGPPEPAPLDGAEEDVVRAHLAGLSPAPATTRATPPPVPPARPRRLLGEVRE